MNGHLWSLAGPIDSKEAKAGDIHPEEVVIAVGEQLSAPFGGSVRADRLIHRIILVKRHLGVATIYADVKAAFPSLSHDYLFHLLEHINMPLSFRTAIRRLYEGNTHQLLLKGQLFPSVTLLSGVRQGCPLSPTLFALAIDPLLHSLQALLPEATIRAFADDIALVVPHMDQHWAAITAVFDEFAAVSGLEINKTNF